MRKPTGTLFISFAIVILTTFATVRGGEVPIRKFQAALTDVNMEARTLQVRHKPTGFTTNVTWDEATKFSTDLTYDIDDVPDGWVECWFAEVNAPEKSIPQVNIIRPLPPGATAPERAGEPKTKTPFMCKLARVPIAAGENKEPWLLTRSGDARYELDVNGERWRLMAGKKRRPLTREVPISPADLRGKHPGLDLVYRQEPGGNRLVSLNVADTAFVAKLEPGGPTGTSAARVATEMTRLRGAHTSVASELRHLMPVRMRVVPEVSLPGEPVKVCLEAWAEKSPNPELKLETGYLRANAAPVTRLSLKWEAGRKTDGLTHYSAELPLAALPVGQHLVSWTCDIGGDVAEYWRSFAVADAGTLVVMFHFTSGKPNEEFDQFRLPYDYWEEKIPSLLGGPFGDRQSPAAAGQWAALSRNYRQRGANPNILTFQGNYAGRTGWPAPIPVQFLREPDDVQRAVFLASRELAGMAGFDPADCGFAGYEFGTRSVAIAREAGVRLVGSMCIHQNWQDGSWGINHSARPLRPYFAAADDFRKAGPGGSDGIVMVSQHDKSILWTEYGVGVFEPAWLEQAWVGGGGGGRTVYDEVFMSRHFDLLAGAIQNTANQRVPFFQSIGIEFSNSKSKNKSNNMVTESNALMIRHAVEQARNAPVVFCHQAAAADFYRRHHAETPETVFYDADYWCGTKADNSITSSWKPVDYPDLMQIENARFSAFFKRPGMLPEYHWDYTQPWHYPDWGNESLPRSVMGLLVPDEHDKFAVTPKITDTRAMRVDRELRESPAGLEIIVTLQTPAAKKAFPLALWDLPREWKANGGWWTLKGQARFIPLRAPFTGNLNGILEVDAKPGVNEYHLLVTTPPRAPASQDVVLESVHAKVFERDGQSMAYVWPARPWDTTIELKVPEGRSVQFYAAPKGERVDLKPGINTLVIPQEQWARIVGLTQAELAAAMQSSQ